MHLLPLAVVTSSGVFAPHWNDVRLNLLIRVIARLNRAEIEQRAIEQV
jgi:hypothetical protein